MTILVRTLAAGAVLVALALPHLAAPAPAHADICTACLPHPWAILARVRPVISPGVWVHPVWRTARLRR